MIATSARASAFTPSSSATRSRLQPLGLQFERDQGVPELIEAVVCSGLDQTALLAFCALLAAPAALADITGRATVIDGDTIEIRSERMRLDAIDAPESAQLCGGSCGMKWQGPRAGWRGGFAT